MARSEPPVTAVAWESLVMAANFLVVDDHPLFLEALQLAIHSDYPASVIVEATSIATAKDEIARYRTFDQIGRASCRERVCYPV